jgi:transposase
VLHHRQRAAILELSDKGLSARQIAKVLKISRPSVKKVVGSKTETVPRPLRPSRLEGHQEEIEELTRKCKGNLVRVHEELTERGTAVSYQALTAFVRSQAPPPKLPAGQYEFAPGYEMQHDTSPHDIQINGRTWRMQTASAVLCYSHRVFFQHYFRFTRFEAKVFLTEALRYFEGAPERIMVDNTSVIRLCGTGREMVPAPEMAAFAERFGFVFVAHAPGNANRSGRVERPFDYIDNNFLAGRTFTDVRDLNRQARQWCQKVNVKPKRNLGNAVPDELYVTERGKLHPLPVFIPEPERVEIRIVDVEGFVNVDRNRYSVPPAWLHRQVQVRVTAERVEIDEGDQTVVHERVLLPLDQRVQLPAHRPPRGEKVRLARELDEERALSAILPDIAPFVAALKRHGRKAPALLLRRLLKMARDYPHDALRAALAEALRYGLYDLERIERMTLERIANDFFRLRDPDER